jgi:hypothetical protein
VLLKAHPNLPTKPINIIIGQVDVPACQAMVLPSPSPRCCARAHAARSSRCRAVSAVGNLDALTVTSRRSCSASSPGCSIGVCLLPLVPVVGRFPQAVALAGAAIANASSVLVYHLLTPRNYNYMHHLACACVLST